MKLSDEEIKKELSVSCHSALIGMLRYSVTDTDECADNPRVRTMERAWI